MYNEEQNSNYGEQGTMEENYSQYQEQQPERETEWANNSNTTGNTGYEYKNNKPKKSFGTKMVKCVAYALAFGLVAGTAFEGSSIVVNRIAGGTDENVVQDSTETVQTMVPTTAVSSTVSKISSVDVSDIVEEVMPSIVSITNLSEIQFNYFGRLLSQESEGAGSGIIVAEDDKYLYIATNNHVVEGATSLSVQFVDDESVDAEVQGVDTTNDLAVVKVAKADMEDDTKSAIKVATVGESDDLAVGQATIAIGNALGYGQSVTTGVVSALDRLVTVEDDTTGETISNRLIQTDAAINPGNSGGALLNAAGEVIGINSSKYSDTSVEGMGFAIPIKTAQPIIEELIHTGTSTVAQHGYLGIYGVDISEEEAEVYKFPMGAYVTQVIEDSPAAVSGLSQGDIITSVNGTEVESFTELKEQISSLRAGDVVTITYQRRGASGAYEENQMSITLADYPDEVEDDDDDQSLEKPKKEESEPEERNPFDDDDQEEYYEEYDDMEDWFDQIFPGLQR